MSEFEHLSLVIACASAVATAIGALATGGAVVVAWRQLGKLVRANAVGQMSALVALEEARQVRHVRMGAAQSNLKTLAEREMRERDDGQTVAADATAKEVSAAEVQYEQALEQYLNVLDRLCFAVRGGAFPESLFRVEYEPLLGDVVTTYPRKFEHGSPFTNILALQARWRSPALPGMARLWPRHPQAPNDLEHLLE